MKKEEIHLADLQRILIGNAPPEFLAEVLVRTILIYLSVLIVVRLLGKRLSGQVTLVEMALLIMLGAVIGSPIQIPDRGILTAFVILVTALLLQRFVNRLAYNYPRFERFTQGKASLLVKNGVLQVEQMRKERVSVQQLFALLRDQEVKQLGEVRRVYLEACGVFSVFKESRPRPGLAVFPVNDRRLLEEHPAAPHGLRACQRCGYVPAHQTEICPVCGNVNFEKAIL